ncbi:MAG TPA: hypothetical protein VKB95_10135 [Chitinophagaceae bacterium]|nr:hypothetical protein [Chitinophagaceae bacterium]
MRIAPFVLLIVLSAACTTKPFVKHSLDFEKIADKCDGLVPGISMNSNLNGERFEFQSCLDADFRKEQVTSYQPNDSTVIIKFERKNSKRALYKLTIDLDAYPRYSLLVLDGDSIPMKRVEP